MKKGNMLIISIIILLIVILVSGCVKNPDDATPIEPSEPDVPKETIKDTTRHDNKLNSIKVFLSTKKTFIFKTQMIMFIN